VAKLVSAAISCGPVGNSKGCSGSSMRMNTSRTKAGEYAARPTTRESPTFIGSTVG